MIYATTVGAIDYRCLTSLKKHTSHIKRSRALSRTQQDRKAETRRRLLDAAATLFAEHGIDAVSVDAVADGAERTSGALYAHFGSKQGLLLALMDEWAHSLVTVMTAEFEIAPSLDDRLRAVVRNVITEPTSQTRRLLLLERELALRAARDVDMAAAMRARSARLTRAAGSRSGRMDPQRCHHAGGVPRRAGHRGVGAGGRAPDASPRRRHRRRHRRRGDGAGGGARPPSSHPNRLIPTF